MLKKIQEEHAIWEKANFKKRESWQPLMGAIEELGELAHAHLKHSQKIRVNEDHIEHAKDAVGDIVIYLIGYCSARGFDMESIVQETWNEVKQRDWIKHPEVGV